MNTLLDIERVRLKKAFRAKYGRTPSSTELRKQLSWSNLDCGPMTTSPQGGTHLVGDGLFVLPVDHYSP